MKYTKRKTNSSELLTWHRLDCRNFNSYLINTKIGYMSRRDNTLLTVCFSLRYGITLKKSRRDDMSIVEMENVLKINAGIACSENKCTHFFFFAFKISL
ncbi:MAG: hypothetical protein LBG80_07095 [Bacteroidales bacterium]|nr:hypothetical protein [Bacteroidales bacterium]